MNLFIEKHQLLLKILLQHQVDFITRINLVEYEEAVDKMKILQDIEGLSIPFIHINHLILSKINTGRAKDKADVEELQRIIRLKNKE